MTTWMIDVQVAHTTFALSLKKIREEMLSVTGFNQTLVPMIGRFDVVAGELPGFKRRFRVHNLQGNLTETEKNRRFQSFIERHKPSKLLTESQLFFYHKFLAIYVLTEVRFHQLKAYFRGQEKFTLYEHLKREHLNHAHALVMDWILHDVDTFNECDFTLFQVRLRFQYLQVPKLMFHYQPPTKTCKESFAVLGLMELGDEIIQFNRFDDKPALEGKEAKNYVEQIKHRGHGQFLLSDY